MSSIPLTKSESIASNTVSETDIVTLNAVPFQQGTPAFIRNPYKARHFLDSLGYALEGLTYVAQHERNFQIHLMLGTVAIVLGLVSHLAAFEWLALVLVCGLVLFAEAINTAIELVVDMITHGEFDARAKVVKDLAAGACLLCALLAVVVGGVIFFPHWFIRI